MASYLCKNRHGTYYFRVVIPLRLRQWFANKREIRRSLKTDSNKVAVKRARALVVRFDGILEQLYAMSHDDDNDTFKTGLITFSSLFGGENTVDYDGDPEKEREMKLKLQRDELELAKEMGMQLNIQVPQAKSIGSALPTWESFSDDYVEQLLKANRIRRETADEYKASYKALTKFTGNNRKLDEFDDELIGAFYDSLNSVSISTRNKHLSRIGGVFSWAVKKKLIATNPVDGVMVINDAVRNRDKRELFTDDELRKIFESDYYRLNEWRSRSNRVRTPFTFWMFPLALFTGARMAELMLIETNNVVTDAGIPYLNLENEIDPLSGEEITRLKNSNSIRQIPISDQLIEMGFIDFVVSCKKRKIKYLFPDIRDKSTGKDAGQKVLSNRLKRFGVWEKGRKSFHSLRHSFINNATANQANLVYLGAVTGHLSKKEAELVPELINTYQKDYPIKLLKEQVIDRLHYGVDFSGVKWL